MIKRALQKPVTVIVSILAILFFSYLAISKIKIDIFPKMGLPTIYVAQPYGGLSPEQMEGFITSYYEYHFLYLTGVNSNGTRWVIDDVTLNGIVSLNATTVIIADDPANPKRFPVSSFSLRTIVLQNDLQYYEM